MNFLAVDTSANYMSVVAMKNGEAFSTFLPDCAMKHSVNILPCIEETLKKADMRLEEIDFFGAVVGAGSFTGIRIGVSAIKGLALAMDKRTLPITSFAVAAYNTIDNGEKLLCLVDALHDCYYACGYEKGEVTFAPAYLTEEEVFALVNEGYTLCACGSLPIAQKTAVKLVNPITGLINAAKTLAKANAFGELNALYVRKSSAEENLKL